ncbi:hypothetical protein QVD17_41714 [Tagetes erecta]|uniref:Uncharacterized protein n=1 Tax=Tagetes erecta TaxID=13708 RepID=A0AAD8JKZ3_TARER|nr:hypothetical protein QVD17_41714 [Tagetes erecta]
MKKTDLIELEVLEIANQAENFIESEDGANVEVVEVTRSKGVAFMVQSEEPKVDSSSSDSDKPSNYVPLPEDLQNLGIGNKNKTGLGFTHEPMPESTTNTLPDNLNTNDHFPENEARLKEFLKKKSDFKISDDKCEVEVFIETNKEKIQNGHPVKIKSYHPKNSMKQVNIAKGSH